MKPCTPDPWTHQKRLLLASLRASYLTLPWPSFLSRVRAYRVLRQLHEPKENRDR